LHPSPLVGFLLQLLQSFAQHPILLFQRLDPALHFFGFPLHFHQRDPERGRAASQQRHETQSQDDSAKRIFHISRNKQRETSYKGKNFFLSFSGEGGFASCIDALNDMAIMHEVDYRIFGDDMQFVEVELDPLEAAVAEAGGMMYMDDGIEMETIFGDGSPQQSGFLGALMGAGKRLLMGESMFMTVFQNRGAGKKRVAFGAPYPGKIIPIHLTEIGGELIAQKDSFLCAAKGVSLGIAFQKRIGVGLFGGEGFIMQRLLGDGWAFIHAGGTLLQRDLATGEVIRVDTGCVTAMQPTINFDVQYVGKIKSALFGGEGLFFATLRGPGRVWLQSLPLSRLADRITAASPRTGHGGREEGSVLGGLGRLLDGDN
jgi:uncharacterized protein (TIGR00266 family)